VKSRVGVRSMPGRADDDEFTASFNRSCTLTSHDPTAAGGGAGGVGSRGFRSVRSEVRVPDVRQQSGRVM
jgi:hypothetical protein